MKLPSLLFVFVSVFSVCLRPSLQGEEILFYSHEGLMEESDEGFLWMRLTSLLGDFIYMDYDKALNTNMVEPIDYRGGEMHVHMKIHSQPDPRQMRVCFNLFQDKSPGVELYREIGTRREDIVGEPGNQYRWVYEIDKIEGWVTNHFWVAWDRDDLLLDWSLPRKTYTVRFWNRLGQEVHAGKNWSGEDTAKWFPLDFTYMVVAVARGDTFSGWENYVTEDGYSLLASNVSAANNYFNGLRHLPVKGLMRSTWFGAFSVLEYPSIVHEDLGVLYCGGEGGDPFWMYSPMEDIGWFWTSSNYYPYLYLLKSQSWAYYYEGSNDPAWFYHYGLKDWISQNPVDSF